MVGVVSRVMLTVKQQLPPLSRWSPDGVLLVLQHTLSEVVDSGRGAHQQTHDV